jgi:hypothetical protein
MMLTPYPFLWSLLPNLLWSNILSVTKIKYLAKLEFWSQTCSHSQQKHNKLSRPVPCYQCLQLVVNLASSRSDYVISLAALESLDMMLYDSCYVGCNRTTILMLHVTVAWLVQFFLIPKVLVSESLKDSGIQPWDYKMSRPRRPLCVHSHHLHQLHWHQHC